MTLELYTVESQILLQTFKHLFKTEHGNDLRALESISLPEHTEDNPTAKLYIRHKYRITFTTVAFLNLVQFLESQDRDGALMTSLMSRHMNIITIDRATDDKYSLAHMLKRSKVSENFPQEDEGIPGHNPGSANTDRTITSAILTKLKLGPLSLEPELLEDLLVELQAEDVRQPPKPGQTSLIQDFDSRQPKETDGEEAPNRTEIPLAPSKARDVFMEVQKVKENRDRLKITSQTGGIGSGVTICMFTFHNTYDRYNLRALTVWLNISDG